MNTSQEGIPNPKALRVLYAWIWIVGIPLSGLRLPAVGFGASWGQSSGSSQASTTTGQQWEGRQQVHGARRLVAADHRLQVSIGLYGRVSDYETVVLLSHRPVIFCTTVVHFVLAMRLGFLYRLWCWHGADRLQKASDA